MLEAAPAASQHCSTVKHCHACLSGLPLAPAHTPPHPRIHPHNRLCLCPAHSVASPVTSTWELCTQSRTAHTKTTFTRCRWVCPHECAAVCCCGSCMSRDASRPVHMSTHIKQEKCTHTCNCSCCACPPALPHTHTHSLTQSLTHTPAHVLTSHATPRHTGAPALPHLRPLQADAHNQQQAPAQPGVGARVLPDVTGAHPREQPSHDRVRRRRHAHCGCHP